jgi:hypothetical protein
MRRLILPALLSAILLVALFNMPTIAQGITNFSNLVLSGDLTVGDDVVITDGITSADITASDDATVGDDLTVGDTISGTWTARSEESVLTIGESGTITPTGTYQRISSASNVGTSSIAGPTEGRMLILLNVGSNTITLTDTGTLKLSGNAALGAGDAVVLLADGTNWNQISPEGDN